MLVEVYVDPACGWSQVVVRWLQDVAARREVQWRLLPYSLLLRDGSDGPPAAQVARRRASLRALRVLAALRDEESARGVAFWSAVIAQDGRVPFADLERAAAQAGVAATALNAADDAALDAAVMEHMTAADALAGRPAVLPLLVLGGRVAFTGPLLRDVPDSAGVTALWDGVLALAATKGFYELSRARPAHPALQGLPPVEVPPVLATAGADAPLGRLVRTYVDRVVNRRDITAVDELVAPDYTGGGLGWPVDREQLRRFYQDQVRERPDWHIDVQETVEVGDTVVVRARAGGTVVEEIPRRKYLEWLAHYRIEEGLIREIRLLSVVPHPPE
jgi:hypothetical protein